MQAGPVKMHDFTIALITIMALFLGACAQPATRSDSKQPTPSTQPQGGTVNGGTTNGGTNNGGSTNGSTMALLPAANFTVLVSGQTPTTLMNIVRNSGKSVGVFEFVGVTCESCKTESPLVTQQLAPYASSVMRDVVFPNQANQYTPAEYQGFVNSYAQGSKYDVDNDLSLLKSIRASSTQYFGIYVIVKSDGTGVVLNQTNAVNSVLPTVMQALGR